MPIAAATTGAGAPAEQATDGSVTVATTDPSEITRESQTTSRNTDGGRDRGERREHAEHTGRDRDPLAAVKSQPHRIDVPDDGRRARRRHRRSRPFADAAASTVAAPLRYRAPSPITPSGVPVVRSTLAAPTLPLPATRTSIPARRASRNANGTEPNA